MRNGCIAPECGKPAVDFMTFHSGACTERGDCNRDGIGCDEGCKRWWYCAEHWDAWVKKITETLNA